MDTIFKKIAEALSSSRETGPGGLWKWIAGVVLAGIGAFVGWWVLRKNGKELAGLRQEKVVAELDAQEAKFNAETAFTWGEIERSNLAAIFAEEHVAGLQLELEALETKHAEDLARIDSIRSWDDVGSR